MRVTGGFALLATAAVLASGAATAQAAPGDVDASYGNQGVASLPDESGDPTVDADGNLLTLNNTPAGSLELRRRTPAGSPDASFGSAGVVRLGDVQLSRGHLAVEPDGSIVVVAYDYADSPASNTFHLFRVLPNGEPDASFAGDGSTELDPGPGFGVATGIAIAPSGRILVAGRVSDKAGVIAATPDGSPDGGFGTGGSLLLGDGTADAIVSAPGGDFFVAWTSYTDGRTEVSKIDAAGALVPGYAVGGTRSLPGSQDSTVLAARPDGGVAVGGYTVIFDLKYTSVISDLDVLDSQGNVDPDFDTLPARTFGNSRDYTIHDLAWDPEGRLLVAGSLSATRRGDVQGAFISRYRPDGSPDGTFGSFGSNVFPDDFTTLPAWFGEIAEQPDGRIIATGYRTAVRFRVDTAGPSDTDGDGVANSIDACPRRSADEFDGCEHPAATISLRYRRAGYKPGFLGSIHTPAGCLRWFEAGEDQRRPVILKLKTAGRDPVLARTTTQSDGPFRFKLDPKRGERYYAKVRAHTIPAAAVCGAARSVLVPR